MKVTWWVRRTREHFALLHWIRACVIYEFFFFLPFLFFSFYYYYFFFMVDSLKAVSGVCCPGLYCPSYESSSQNNIFYFPFYSFPISTIKIIISRSQTILSYRLKTKAIGFSLGYPIIIRRCRAAGIFIVRMYSHKRISNGLPVVDKVLSEYIRQAYSV